MLVLTLLALSARAAQDDPLEIYRWKNRVLLVATPSIDDTRYQQQAAALLPAQSELNDRHITVIVAPPGDARRQRFHLPDDAFMIAYVGLDGGIKLARREALPAATLFAETDRNSTRTSEQREQSRARSRDGANVPITADELIELLKLEPSPSLGGLVRQVQRNPIASDLSSGEKPADLIAENCLLVGAHGRRHFARAVGPETWSFNAGDSVEVLVLSPDGTARLLNLGSAFDRADQPEFAVASGDIFSIRVRPGGILGWSLLTRTAVDETHEGESAQNASPVLDELAAQFPDHNDWFQTTPTPSSQAN